MTDKHDKILGQKSSYHPESYWSDVAKRIKSREGKNVVAGDDEPFYRYKRERFLEMLHEVAFQDKSVLEIGNGPGGNLREITKHKPARLVGADISADMIELAKANNSDFVELVKIDGTSLPFKDDTFDIVFTATVLQHNTDDEMMRSILNEICRVSKDKIYLFEKIDSKISGDDLCYARPVKYYESLVAPYGFKLASVENINIRSSYYISGAIRKGLNSKSRKEGEPLNKISTILQKVTLPITKVLDKVFSSHKDVARMEFVMTQK